MEKIVKVKDRCEEKCEWDSQRFTKMRRMYARARNVKRKERGYIRRKRKE
jgi:hypothetical protein